jgi:hypothetical protein
MMRSPLTLYGMQVSWYSTKVRGYLRYKGIDHVERPPTLIDYYVRFKRRFGNPAIPVVRTAGARLPRITPEVRFPFADGTHARRGFPYALWMAQRTLDIVATMPAHDAAKVRRAMAPLGGKAFLALDIPRLRQAGLHAALDPQGIYPEA